jgi:hypothetical protein
MAVVPGKVAVTAYDHVSACGPASTWCTPAMYVFHWPSPCLWGLCSSKRVKDVGSQDESGHASDVRIQKSCLTPSAFGPVMLTVLPQSPASARE